MPSPSRTFAVALSIDELVPRLENVRCGIRELGIDTRYFQLGSPFLPTVNAVEQSDSRDTVCPSLAERIDDARIDCGTPDDEVPILL